MEWNFWLPFVRCLTNICRNVSLLTLKPTEPFFFKYHGVRVVSTPLQMSFLSAAAALHRGISHFSTLTKINIDKNI